MNIRARLKKVTSLYHIDASGDIKIFDPQDALPAKAPRRYTDLERRKMARYEAVTTYESQTTVYKDHLERRSREPRWFIWGFVVLIGVLTALTAVFMVSSLHVLYAVKMRMLDFGLQGFSFSDPKGPLSNDEQYTSVAHVFEGQDTHLWGMPNKNLGGGFIMWIVFTLVMSLGSSLISAVVPESIGAGSAEVMAYLNGVDNVALADIRVFAAKIGSTLFIIASGACVGHYGPLIQLGTMIATLLLERSKVVRFDNVHVIQSFRNPRDRRIITVIGAAAGVASAFSVSIGGLMVVMEQLATVLPVRFALYVFVTGLISTITLQTYFSYVSYFQLRPRDSFFSGQLLSDALILFDTKSSIISSTIPMNLLDFLPAIVLGLLCGSLAVVFLRISAAGLKFRRFVEKRYNFPAFRFVQPVIVNTIYMGVVYWLAVVTTSSADSCLVLPQEILANRNTSVVSYYGITGTLCDPFVVNTTIPGGNSTFSIPPIMHTFSSLSFGFPDSTLQLLFTWNTPNAIPAWVLFIFGTTYFFFSAYSSSTTLSGDVMLPSMVLGAVVGRLVGILFHQIAQSASSNPSEYRWADPGTFALFGAGCFLSATTGLTFSICVILMEITDDFRHILPVMLGISIAKKVCARFSHDFGTAYLEARCVPLLDFADEVYKYDMFSARHVMSTEVLCVGTVCTIAELIDILESCTHNGFPVESLRDGTFKGIILRSEIEALLWHMYFTNGTQMCSYEFRERVEDRMFHEDRQGIPQFHESWLDERIDLSPYIDQSCFSISETTSLSRTYTLFRTLGLRHLVVVSRENKIVGMITRKDLVSDNIVERILLVNNARKEKNKLRANSAYVDAGEQGYGPPDSMHTSTRSGGSLTDKLLRFSKGMSSGRSPLKPPASIRDEEWIVIDDEEDVQEESMFLPNSSFAPTSNHLHSSGSRRSAQRPRSASATSADERSHKEHVNRILRRDPVPDASDDDGEDAAVETSNLVGSGSAVANNSSASYHPPIVPDAPPKREAKVQIVKEHHSDGALDAQRRRGGSATAGRNRSQTATGQKLAATIEQQRQAVQDQLASRQRSSSHLSQEAGDVGSGSDDSVDLLRDANLGPTVDPTEEQEPLYSPTGSPIQQHQAGAASSFLREGDPALPAREESDALPIPRQLELAHRDGHAHSARTSEESMVTVKAADDDAGDAAPTEAAVPSAPAE